MKSIFKDTGGSVAVYTAVFSVVAIGAGALALDIGRMATLRVEMQQIADAAALAAADQLDGLEDAATRAEQVAINTAVRMDSAFDSASVGVEVSAVNFYYLPADSFNDQGNPNDPNWDPYNKTNWVSLPNALTDASESGRATIAEVVLSPRPINFYLSPVYALFGGATLEDSEVNANAAAIAESFICQAPPMFACWYDSTPDEHDIMLEQNIGKLMVLREMAQTGGTFNLASGNFGFLDPIEGNGANAVADQLANPGDAGCYGTTVTTKPGIMQVPAAKAVDARFDSNESTQAPNVYNFRDGADLDLSQANLLGTKWNVGNGLPLEDVYSEGNIPNVPPRLINSNSIPNADPNASLAEKFTDGYWGRRHWNKPNNGNWNNMTPPSEVPASALEVKTRFQMYLYELGITFRSSDTGETWIDDENYGDDDERVEPTDWTEVVPPHGPDDPEFAIPNSHELELVATYNAQNNGPPISITGDRRFNGTPNNTTNEEYDRRLFDIVVLDCSDGAVQGRSTGHRPRGYLEVFLTRDAIPGDANNAGTGNGGGADPLSFVAEIQRVKTAGNSSNVYDRVRLIN